LIVSFHTDQKQILVFCHYLSHPLFDVCAVEMGTHFDYKMPLR